MSVDLSWLPMVTNILGPVIGSVSNLAADIIDGRKSLTVATAELRGILSVAATRLDDFDKQFADRDRANDARVAAAPADPNKP